MKHSEKQKTTSTKKRLVLFCIIAAVGVFGFLAACLYGKKSADAPVVTADFSTRRIFLKLKDGEELENKDNVIADYNSVYLMSFKTEKSAKDCYDYYKDKAEFIDTDGIIDIADSAYNHSANDADFKTNPLDALKTAEKTAKPQAAKTIALIDTGVKDYIPVKGSYSVIGTEPVDDNGHGTQMFYAMKEQNPKANIISIKAADRNGHATSSSVYAAMTLADKIGCQIINVSMSSLDLPGTEGVQSLISELTSRGVTVVTSAGDNDTRVDYTTQARDGNALVVGACDDSGTPNIHSNYGEGIDYYVKAGSSSKAAAILSGYLTNSTAITPDGNTIFTAGQKSYAQIDKNADSSYTGNMPKLSITSDQEGNDYSFYSLAEKMSDLDKAQYGLSSSKDDLYTASLPNTIDGLDMNIANSVTGSSKLILKKDTSKQVGEANIHIDKVDTSSDETAHVDITVTVPTEDGKTAQGSYRFKIKKDAPANEGQLVDVNGNKVTDNGETPNTDGGKYTGIKDTDSTSGSSSTSGDTTNENDITTIDGSGFDTMRILVKASDTLPKYTENVIAHYEDIYLLQFRTIRETQNAYVWFYKAGYEVQKDSLLYAASGTAGTTSTVPYAAMTETDNPFVRMKSALGDGRLYSGSIVLADTGAPKDDSIVNSITLLNTKKEDKNGHAGDNLDNILSRDKNAEIVTTKVLGDNGIGCVSAAMAAAWYAKEVNADYLVMPFASVDDGNFSVASTALEEAEDGGVTIIAAAGNNALDTANVFPAGVDGVVTAGAADGQGNRLSISNYGDNVAVNVAADTTSVAAAKLAGEMADKQETKAKTKSGFAYDPDKSGRAETANGTMLYNGKTEKTVWSVNKETLAVGSTVISGYEKGVNGKTVKNYWVKGNTEYIYHESGNTLEKIVYPDGYQMSKEVKLAASDDTVHSKSSQVPPEEAKGSGIVTNINKNGDYTVVVTSELSNWDICSVTAAIVNDKTAAPYIGQKLSFSAVRTSIDTQKGRAEYDFVFTETGRDENSSMPGYSPMTGSAEATFYDDTELKLTAFTEDVRSEIAGNTEEDGTQDSPVLDLAPVSSKDTPDGNSSDGNTDVSDAAAFDVFGNPVKQEDTSIETTYVNGTRLLVGTDNPTVLRADADRILSCYDGVYLLQYDSAAEAEKAYNLYNGHVDYLEVDRDTVTAADNSDSTASEDNTAMTEEDNPIARMENEGSGAEAMVALIDTGASKSSNVVDAVSMLGDNADDDNGHGTKMVQTMTEVNPDIRILSIKALDENGKGTPSAVYAGIEYAIERGVKVINLSFSGPKTQENSSIAKAIDDAYQAGIVVIGAAGNNGTNALYTIPGGVDHVDIAGACNADGKRLAISNYGKTVNYYVIADSTSEAAAILTANASLNDGAPLADGKTVFEPDDDGEPITDDDYYVIDPNGSGVTVATAESGSLATLQAYKNLSNFYLSDLYHMSADEFVKRLTENQNRYLHTPYGGIDPSWATMQCTSFIWRAIHDAGLDVYGEKESSLPGKASKVGSFENYWRANNVHMESYVTVEELLSHHPQKGDIIIMHPRCNVEYGVPPDFKYDQTHNVSDAHIGIYWGSYDGDNYMWHSFHGNSAYHIYKIPVGPESWYYSSDNNEYPVAAATKFIDLPSIFGPGIGENNRTVIAPKCDSWYLLVRWGKYNDRGRIALRKYSSDGKKTVAGASFKIYRGTDVESREVNGRTYYVVKSGAKPVTYESIRSANPGDTRTGDAVLTTDAYGRTHSMYLPTLSAGYYVQEVSAPDGYKAVTNPADSSQNYVYKAIFMNENDNPGWDDTVNGQTNGDKVTKVGNAPTGPQATLQLKLTKLFNGKSISEASQQCYSYTAKIKDCGDKDPGTAPLPSDVLPGGRWSQWGSNLKFGKTETKVIKDTSSSETTQTWVEKHKYYLVAIRENTPADGSKPDDMKWHYLILTVSYNKNSNTASSNIGTTLKGGNINNTGTTPPPPGTPSTPPPIPETDGELEILKKNTSKHITRLNPGAYSLAGTVFGLYDSNHKLVREYTLTGSGDEVRMTIKVKPNTLYYLEELKGGKNFNPKPVNMKDGFRIGSGETYVKTIGNDANLASQIHVVKHDKVSGKRLEGASFAVYAVKNGSESYVCDMADIGNGEYVSQMITLDPETGGHYRVRETAAPVGHTGNAVIDIDLNKTAPFTHSLYGYCDNASSPVTVRLHKTDFEDSTKNLSDGVFTIAPLTGNGKTGASTEMTWNASSECYEAVVQPDESNSGRFKITETKAPDQYQGGWSQIVQLDTSKLTDVFEFNAVNKLIPYTGEIHMQKLDEDTGEKYKDGLFQVYEYNASTNSYETTPITKLVWDEDKQEWNLGRTWNDQTQSWDYHKLNCYYKASDMQFYGHYNLGRFKIVEERQPAGCLYEKKEVEVTFEKPSRRDTTISKNIVIKNKKNQFHITKVNADGTPLAGVTYRFGTLDDDPGAYRKGITDANGKLSIVGLQTGRWVYYEESTIDGYTLDDTKKYFTIDADGRMQGKNDIEIAEEKNYSKIPLTISKTAADGTVVNNFPEGTVFSVYEWDKNQNAYKNTVYCTAAWDKNQKEFVDTDTMGKPSLSYTPDNEGKFRVVETQASNGYILDTEPQDVTIPAVPSVSGVSVSFKNTSNTFELTKLDQNGNKLDGVTFHIWKDGDIDSVDNYHVTKDGTITLRGLTPGLWYYQETAAPDGYYVNPAQGQFTVQPNGKIDSKDDLKVVRIDYPEGKLKIAKISDNIIGNFPEGTEFLLYEYDTATGTYKDTPSMRIIYKEQS